MTEQEFNALIVVLNRAPLTPGEALWINALMLKLQPKAETPVSEAVIEPPVVETGKAI